MQNFDVERPYEFAAGSGQDDQRLLVFIAFSVIGDTFSPAGPKKTITSRKQD